MERRRCRRQSLRATSKRCAHTLLTKHNAHPAIRVAHTPISSLSLCLQTQALLTGGAALAHRDLVGTTPLMAAAQGGNAEIVTACLDAGRYTGYIDARDENGYSAVFHACAYGHKDVAKLLAERGADIDTPTRAGRTLANLDASINSSLDEVREARKVRAAQEAANAEALAE